MIGYVTLGTNQFERACQFYDALLGQLGATRMMQEETFVAWTLTPTSPALSVVKPFDGAAATAGNGTMVALMMKTPDEVDAFHKKAMDLGGTNEGDPGPRGNNGFYAGYFRDLDGNKLNAFCMTTADS